MKYLATCAVLAGLLTFAVSYASPAEEANKNDKKLADATAAYHELVTAPDRGVPAPLLEKCKCIAVLPGVIKAAVGYGARHGTGVMSCRGASGWSTPAFVGISGGSVGFQLGAESTDIVLFFMNDAGARSLMNGSRITLGGKASVAAGPFGRSGEAATDLKLQAQIYSYARSKGLFAGVSLEGSRLAPNAEANTGYYGAGVTYKQLLFGPRPTRVPAAAAAFTSALP